MGKHTTDAKEVGSMQISTNHKLLFWLSSIEEEQLMAMLHEYLDNMFFAN